MKWMTLKRCTQPVYRIKCSGRHVIERSPVIRNEIFGLQQLEQGESIGAGEVPFSKSRFPPGGVSYGQQGNIEASTIDCQMILYKPCGIGRERRVTGKKTGRLISIYQIHICCTPPSVDPVSVSF